MSGFPKLSTVRACFPVSLPCRVANQESQLIAVLRAHVWRAACAVAAPGPARAGSPSSHGAGHLPRGR